MAYLTESTVIIAAQRPALYLHVPLTVFLAECIFGVMAYIVVGLWVLVLLPLHFWFVAMTNQDFLWPKKLWATWTLHWRASNRGVKRKGVVTFIPNPVNKES